MEHVPGPSGRTVGLLIADGDASVRSVLAARARETVEGVVVCEAADGAEAIQVALQQRPAIALLDCELPLLCGLGVTLVLRELLPGLRVGLRTANPAGQSAAARELCLPLFHGRDVEHALRWVDRQARTRAPRPAARVPASPALHCM
jgi:CheY-like chemotaxis protein